MNSTVAGIRRTPLPRIACPGRTRHWFTLWGMPGYRSPVCMTCGAPNPRLMDGEDWAKLIWYRQRIMSGPFRNAALEQAYQDRIASAPVAGGA